MIDPLILDLAGKLHVETYEGRKLYTIVIRQTHWVTQGDSIEEAVADIEGMVVGNLRCWEYYGELARYLTTELLHCSYEDIPSIITFRLSIDGLPNVYSITVRLMKADDIVKIASSIAS